MTEQKERPNLYGVPTSAGAMMTKDPEPDWCHSGLSCMAGQSCPFMDICKDKGHVSHEDIINWIMEAEI